jgi:protein subunit release factor A
MSCNFYEGKMKLIYIPTGESVLVDKSFSRSQFKQRNMAVKILRSRLWAEQNGLGRSDEIISTYDILGDEYPNDLNDYREKIK